jgi:hypothetical protein
VVLIALTVAWVPVLVAHHYADGPGGAEVNRGRIDQGWRFMYDAVRESRGALLGHDGAALTHSQLIWTRPSGRSLDVELVYLDGPFDVPVPAAGADVPPGRERVVPPSRFAWIVWGRVRGGPRQVIGVLDYGSGRVVWDIRPRLRRTA